MKTNVYVDGFNFYHGAVENTRYRWLNFRELAGILLPNDRISEVHYFTARVKVEGSTPGSPQRQDVYIRALRSVGVRVHEGTFLKLPTGRTTEKASDVNLATQLLLDCFDEKLEQGLILSADSDLNTPLRTARDRFKINVVAAFPLGRSSAKLRKTANNVLQIWELNLKDAQLPDPVVDGSGAAIHCPPEWIGGPRQPPSYHEFQAKQRRDAQARAAKRAAGSN